MTRAAILGLLVVAACSDALEQDTTAGQVIAVAETQPFTVALVSADNLVVSQSIPLPAGASGSVSGLGSVLIVPNGPSVAILDLALSSTAVSRVVLLVS